MKELSSSWINSIKQLFSPVRVKRRSVPLALEQLGNRIVPAGVTVFTAFFGTTSKDNFDNVSMSFNQEIDPATFSAADVVITGPDGAVPVTGITPTTPGANDAFTITFAEQTKVGDYKIQIGPDIRNAGGEKMDQNQNGILGEAGDVFESFPQALTNNKAAGPVIDVGTGFSGKAAGTFDKLQVVFQPSINGVDEATFTADDVTITDPNGKAVAVTKVTPVAGAFVPTFDITFAAQTELGDYKAVVGPDIFDLNGAGMDQNQDGTPLQADEKFEITNTLNAAPAQGPTYAIGASDGSLRMLDADTANSFLFDFRPLDTPASKYTGLLSVALGDFNGDGTVDLLVAAANPVGVKGLDATKAGKVFVYDGTTLAGGTPTLLRDFVPFATTDGPGGKSGAYVNGLNIAAGDVNGDGKADLISGTRGGSATAGKIESGRVSIIDGGSPAGASNLIGGILSPFSTGYQKGVIVAAGDMDGDGKSEIAVTRGGPVASTNDAVETIKVKAFRLNGAALDELNLSGTGTPLAPFGTVGAVGNRIVRDGRVTFVDSDGDGKDELVFTALDRSTDPANVKIRIGVYSVNTATGLATLTSTGTGGTPTSYLYGNQVVDHAISFVARAGVPVNDLALAVEGKSTNDTGLFFINSLTGANKTGVVIDILTGGVSLDGS